MSKSEWSICILPFWGTHQIQNETGPTHWSQFNMKAKGRVKPESIYEPSLFQRLPDRYHDSQAGIFIWF